MTLFSSCHCQLQSIYYLFIIVISCPGFLFLGFIYLFIYFALNPAVMFLGYMQELFAGTDDYTVGIITVYCSSDNQKYPLKSVQFCSLISSNLS